MDDSLGEVPQLRSMLFSMRGDSIVVQVHPVRASASAQMVAELADLAESR